ncbi:MAG: NAD(P)-dependent alcohol dehydrogenase [Jiangellaceae bacterium]
MTMMQASVLRAVHDLIVEERPVPQPSPREVLVRIKSVGVCGSDVHYYEHGRIGDHVVREPLVLGHEPSGEIVAVGAEVTRLTAGQRVSIEPGVPCLSCEQCLAGRYNLCPRMRFLATPPIDGAFCEYLAVHEAFAHPVPDTLSDDAAAMLEPLSVGIWACRKGRVEPGSRVLVNGAGPVGLLAAQSALAFGAARVVVADVSESRLALAGRLGATDIVDVRSATLGESGVEPDVLLECSGHPEATVAALRTLAPAGRAVLVGMGADVLPLPLPYVQNREIELVGTFRYANTWPTAIALAASGRVVLDPLVTHHYSLLDVGAALTAGGTDPSTVKVVVTPTS